MRLALDRPCMWYAKCQLTASPQRRTAPVSLRPGSGRQGDRSGNEKGGGTPRAGSSPYNATGKFG